MQANGRCLCLGRVQSTATFDANCEPIRRGRSGSDKAHQPQSCLQTTAHVRYKQMWNTIQSHCKYENIRVLLLLLLFELSN